MAVPRGGQDVALSPHWNFKFPFAETYYLLRPLSALNNKFNILQPQVHHY